MTSAQLLPSATRSSLLVQFPMVIRTTRGGGPWRCWISAKSWSLVTITALANLAASKICWSVAARRPSSPTCAAEWPRPRIHSARDGASAHPPRRMGPSSHPEACSCRHDRVIEAPCRIQKAGPDVIWFKVRIVLENATGALTRSQKLKHVDDPDSQAADARTASALLRIVRNPAHEFQVRHRRISVAAGDAPFGGPGATTDRRRATGDLR